MVEHYVKTMREKGEEVSRGDNKGISLGEKYSPGPVACGNETHN